MKSILDPRFRYTSSVDTDIRKTFARVRREQRGQKPQQQQQHKGEASVLTLHRGKEKAT